jgi:hypothetical protein
MVKADLVFGVWISLFGTVCALKGLARAATINKRRNFLITLLSPISRTKQLSASALGR